MRITVTFPLMCRTVVLFLLFLFSIVVVMTMMTTVMIFIVLHVLTGFVLSLIVLRILNQPMILIRREIVKAKENSLVCCVTSVHAVWRGKLFGRTMNTRSTENERTETEFHTFLRTHISLKYPTICTPSPSVQLSSSRHCHMLSSVLEPFYKSQSASSLPTVLSTDFFPSLSPLFLFTYLFCDVSTIYRHYRAIGFFYSLSSYSVNFTETSS